MKNADNSASKPVVYFDGSCPLCRAEIKHYSNLEGADALRFVNVADRDSTLGADLDRDSAMARFHVRSASGELMSGAKAFSHIWAYLPRWRWAARIAQLPGITGILELAYRCFLPIRPTLSRLAGRLLSEKPSNTH